MTNRWQPIWQNRARPENGSTLQTLLSLDGYDAFGALSEADWQSYISGFAARLGLKPGESIFDVGCGAGAVLYPLYEQGYRVAGLDYSEALVQVAREVMPGADIRLGEADELDPSERFDLVLSHAVFLYFPSLEYAANVLQRMLEKARRMVAVLDVPDLATREQALAFRRQALGEQEYARKYEGLDHLYFDRDWFRGTLAGLATQIEIQDQALPKYAHNPYRFNVFITPAGAAS
jgi:SAM-dependent methyltransferase